MKSFTIAPVSLLFFICFPCLVKAQDDLADRLISKTQALIQQKMESDKIVGVSAALIVKDSIVWKKAYGFSDQENQVPMTENTVFHIGSITKPITALCAMQLQEQGLLDIHQPVIKYLPQFNPKNQFGDNSEVTVKDLITHSAGLQGDIWKNSDLNSGKYTDVVDFIKETHLLYPPGRLSFYSNSGYNILGHIIKEVSGMDYADYVHDHIFKSLGMQNSGFFMDSLENRTKIYDRAGKHIKEYPLRDIASGGIYCDLHDFALLGKGIINSYHNQRPFILKSTTMKEVLSIQNGDVDFVTGKNKRGLGWYLFENEKGLAINHTGSAGYAFAHLMIFPKDKAAIMIFTNAASGRNLAENAAYNLLEAFQLKIADVFLKPIINKEEVAVEEPVKVSKKELKKYVGNYSQTTSYSKVFLEKDTLKIIRNKEQFSLIPKTPSSFIPIDTNGRELKNTQYFFKDIATFPCLILKRENSEQVLGYKFGRVNTKKWDEKIGRYEHFGYQLIAGNGKFKSIEIKITEDQVLLAILNGMDNSSFPLPLDLISQKYAKTAGFMSGFGMTASFSENDQYHFVDFAGITFRKEK